MPVSTTNASTLTTMENSVPIWFGC